MNAPVQSPVKPASALGPEVRGEPYGPGKGLPLFITPVDPALANDLDAAVSWLRDRQALFDELLCEVGAVVLRGFAFRDTAGFSRAVEHYPEPVFGYMGGAAPRAHISGRAFEATHAPAEAKLPFHQEMAYLPQYPSKLAFFCNAAPETGGETLIADVRRFDEMLPKRFRDEIKARGVRYTRNFRSPDWSTGDAGSDIFHRPWTEAMVTTDPQKAEAGCKAMGLECRWEANGSFSVIYEAAGFVTHPRTGREIWFNQIPSQTPNIKNVGPERLAIYKRVYDDAGLPRPYNTTYADGGQIAPDDLASIYPILDELEVAFSW
ncbi:MAG: syringomycin synthesis regulator SyrP, partial [Phenylobacterium sp.]|nr:syringomycin synthesis regulator SyrP [Phenylobacterium sp.]